MKQKELSILLRIVVLLCGLVWLVFAHWFGRTLAISLVEKNDQLLPSALLCLMLVPMLAAIVDAWRIFTDIGRNRSFTKTNARRLRRVSLYALADTVLLLPLAVFRRWIQPYITTDRAMYYVLLIIIAFVGVAVTTGTAALSHLTLKAADLQDENDLTI